MSIQPPKLTADSSHAFQRFSTHKKSFPQPDNADSQKPVPLAGLRLVRDLAESELSQSSVQSQAKQLNLQCL